MYQSQPPGHEAQLASSGKHEYSNAMNRRLEHLYALGVLRVRLQADEGGLPTFVAMPDKPLNLLAPINYYRVCAMIAIIDSRHKGRTHLA